MAPPPTDHPERTALESGPEPGPEAGVDGEATRLEPAPPSVSGIAAGGTRFAPETAAVPAAPPSAPPSPGPIGPGTLLSHTYLVEGLIARGGMGEVHRARHIDLNTWHAVKVIRPELAQDTKMVELLRREAAALREIRHEAVVAYDGIVRDEFGRLLLSMEYLDGPSLHEVLKDGPLDPDAALRLLGRVASGLAAAHQRGIVHRDMSTDNIILPGRRVADAKIIDFGIAKQTAMEAGTVIGDSFAGKYGYAAPEQFGLFGGTVGPQSDIYSAGLVLAAAALGQPLDMGRTPQAMIERRLSVPDLAAVAEPLRGILESMLAPDPQDRVKTMAELAGAPAGWRLASPTPTLPPSSAIPQPSAVSPAPTTVPPTPTITPFAATPFPAAPATPPAPPTPAATVASGKAGKAPVGIIAAVVVAAAAAGVAGVVILNRPQPEPPAAAIPAAAPPPVSAPPVSGPPVPVAPPPASPSNSSPPVATAAVAPEPPPAAIKDTPKEVPKEVPKEPARVETAAPAPPSVAMVAPPPAAPPAPDMAVLRRQIETAAGGLSCAGVRVTESGENRLLLTGYVGKEGDAQTLRALAGGLPAPVRLDSRVAVRPWPLCEALGAAGLPGRAEQLGTGGIALTLSTPSQRFRQGEKLEVTVKAGASGGHLTVDYIDLEGNAIHMVPMPLRRDDRVTPGQTVTLGIAASSSDRVYTISPPFGPAMILAVVTRSPLFPADRAEAEPASDYLPRLRTALAAADRDGGVVAQSAFFTTLAD